jgi:hypothetical protein
MTAISANRSQFDFKAKQQAHPSDQNRKMKLFLVLLSLLAFAAAKKSSLRSADDMVVTVQETHYTFDVDADIEPNASAAVDDFVSTCLVSSFNTIHNPTQYRVIAVDVESEIIVPDSNNLARSVTAKPTKSCEYLRFSLLRVYSACTTFPLASHIVPVSLQTMHREPIPLRILG